MNFSRSPSHPSRSLPSGGVMLLVLLALAVLVLVPGMAHAADLFAVPAGDKSKTLFLDKIFGDFSNSPLAGPVSVFNSAVLFVGGILAAYTIIAGTMSTAHDGEMLGKKWSSMWIPVRTAVGTAAILPVLNGFCVAQAIVLWLATQGIGLADAVWNQFSANPIQTLSVSTSAVPNNVMNLALAMLQGNLCDLTYQKYAQQQQSDALANGQATLATASFSEKLVSDSGFANSTSLTSLTSAGIGYQYGETTGAEGTGGQTLCGMVFLDSTAPTQPASTGITSADELSTNAMTISSSVTTAQQNAFKQLQSDMKSAAAAFLSDSSFNVLGAVNTATTNYANSINAAAKAAASSSTALNAFRQDVQEDGWAYAGAWYMKLIRMQDQINGAANRTPTVQPPAGIDTIVNTNGAVSGELNKLDTVIRQQAAQTGSGVQKAALADMSFSSSSHTTMGKLSDLLDWFTTAAHRTVSAVSNPQELISGSMGSLLDFSSQLNDPTQNGLLAAKNFGDNIIMAGWILAGVGSALAISLAGIGAALIPISLAFMLWTTGAGLSVVLPMTPFIMWVGIVIGWLTQVVEAIYAAPLWATVHLHPDGDGVVGRGGAGYSLILALTLRPSLMILGLISAIVLMDPITHFLNSVFFGAFALMQGNTVSGPVTLIATAAMYCSAMFMVIRKTFGLIHAIPDHILAWIGNGAPGLGGSATAAAEQAQSGHQSIIAGVGRGASTGMGAISSVRQLKAQREGNAKQERAALAQERANEQANEDRGLDLAEDARASGMKADTMPDETRDAAVAAAQGALDDAKQMSPGGAKDAAMAAATAAMSRAQSTVGPARQTAMDLAKAKYQRFLQHTERTGTGKNADSPIQPHIDHAKKWLADHGVSSGNAKEAQSVSEARAAFAPPPQAPNGAQDADDAPTV